MVTLDGRNHRRVNIDDKAWTATLLLARAYGWRPLGAKPPTGWAKSSVASVYILPASGIMRVVYDIGYYLLKSIGRAVRLWDSADYYNPMGQIVEDDDAMNLSNALEYMRDHSAIRDGYIEKIASLGVLDALIRVTGHGGFTIRGTPETHRPS